MEKVCAFISLARLFLWKILFPKSYKEKHLKKVEFLQRFPCPHCRPDGCSFFLGWKCTCSECGREYEV